MAYKKKEYEQKDYKEELRDTVVKNLEEAIYLMENKPDLAFKKPWITINRRPINPATKTEYSGINVISTTSRNFNDHRWMTFNNAGVIDNKRIELLDDIKLLNEQLESKKITYAQYDLGIEKAEMSFRELHEMGLDDRNKPFHIMKGAKACPIFKAVQVPVNSKDNPENQGETTDKENPEMMWVYAFAGNVFNATQISNMKPLDTLKLEFIPHEEAEIHLQAMISKTDLTYREENQTRAFYRQADHSVNMPLRENFKDVNSFYAVLAHELVHSTGPKLGRDLSGGFGSSKYAFEELVADIGGRMQCADLGLEYNSSDHENHVAYWKSWLGALKNDKNLLFKAASKAEKSVSYQNEIRLTYKKELALQNEHRNDLKQEGKVIPSTIKNKSLEMSI